MSILENWLKDLAVVVLVLGLLLVAVGDAGSSAKASAEAAARSLTVNSVQASSNDGNMPENTLDGDLSTRWSAPDDGSWIEYDLGAAKSVGSVAVAFYKGDQRTADFDIRVSENGSSYTTVLSGATSNGTDVELQNFDFADREARYVRIVGFGNSRNDWNSITEVEVYGEGQEVVDPDYGKLAKDYADAMVADGRDRYGSANSPLFATMLDRESMRLIPNVKGTVPMTREQTRT